MSFGICCCCWPFFKSDKESTSVEHEDVPLLVVSDPQKDAFTGVYPPALTEDEDEDFKNLSLKISKPKQNDPSDGATGVLNPKFTLHEQSSESDEWEIPSQKKIPLWQQLERIKSPTDDRPPMWK